MVHANKYNRTKWHFSSRLSFSKGKCRYPKKNVIWLIDMTAQVFLKKWSPYPNFCHVTTRWTSNWWRPIRIHEQHCTTPTLNLSNLMSCSENNQNHVSEPPIEMSRWSSTIKFSRIVVQIHENKKVKQMSVSYLFPLYPSMSGLVCQFTIDTELTVSEGKIRMKLHHTVILHQLFLTYLNILITGLRFTKSGSLNKKHGEN